MNDFIDLVQWSTISVLLFFSGFELASQVVNNHMTWNSVDWSLTFFCWIASFLIYQLGRKLNSTRITQQSQC